MATRQITIDDGSKKRKQVDFDVQPLSLKPTITNGGNYNVFAAPTPKTNQALQLSESLKQLPKLGNQFAKIQQGIGQERADLIQGQDAEEELKRLKKEEPETFMNFMRRKAYTDSLIEKHIRTDMVPNTLRGLKKSANARVYGNEKDFNANIDEQLSSSWQSFEQSVGADVANSTEGKTIWNNLADEMRVQAQSAYFESQDKVALENDIESLEHRIASQLSPTDIEGNAREIDLNFVSDLTKTAIPELMSKHGMSRGEASTHLRKIMATRLETLQVKGKNLMVLDLAEAMGRTVSKDGVRIYEGDSATALSMARTLAAARKEIEDLEDEENDIDQSTQKEFVGQSGAAHDKLKNGTRWSELTPTGQQIVLMPLQTLDPTFTMERLSDAMAPTDGDAGGGLEVFSALMDEISVTGSDRSVSLLNMTRTATINARVTAGQLKGEPKVITGSVKRETVERAYRDAAVTDADLTLQKFLKRENILSWPSLDLLEGKLKSINTFMRDPVYDDIPKQTKLVVDAVYSSYDNEESATQLGLVTKSDIAVYANTFSNQIQTLMKDEAEMGLIKASVTPEEKAAGIKTYLERQKELVDNTRTSIEMIIKETEGADINFQDKRVFDSEVGKQELEHNTISDTARIKDLKLRNFLPFGHIGSIIPPNEAYEMEAPFKTNESKLKPKKEKTGEKAFFVYPLSRTYRTEWSREEINTDRQEMIKRIDAGVDTSAYQEQLAYSLYSHGLDMKAEPEKSIELMKKAKVDGLDVPMFTERQDALMFGNQVLEVFNKIVAVEKLTPQDVKLVEQAKYLGLIVEGKLNKDEFISRANLFTSAQYSLIK
jgi:hypothetical protein